MRETGKILRWALFFPVTICLCLATWGWGVAAEQMVTLTPATYQTAGEPVAVDVMYNVSDGNSNLAGLVVNVHYDSSKLEFAGFKGFLEVGAVLSPPTKTPDADDLDEEDSTDTMVNISWVSLFKSWPGRELPLSLATLEFIPAEGAVGEAFLNVTIKEKDVEYDGQASGASVQILE